MTASRSPTAALRLTAQLLAGTAARSPEEVAHRVLAVQAQDGRGFRLAVRARTSGLAAADVDHALTTTRTLVVSWLNRGTLHLVTPADYWLLQPLTTPQLLTGSARRLRQEGVSPSQAERGVDIVAEAVRDGPRTRQELRRLLDAAGVPTARQALVHVLMAASLRGDVVRGPMIGRDHAFVSVTDWLGPRPDELDREEMLATLARRYLHGHAPASAEDMARWGGLTIGDARRGFAAIADEVASVGDAGSQPRDAADASPIPPPRLLGPFDPLLHGWASRELFVGPHTGVVTTNGLFRPSALVSGRVVGSWGLSDGVLTLHPLEAIGPSDLRALRSDAADVLRFLGMADEPMVVT